MILSSQSSDDVFCDSPWRRLLQDLGSDACDILKRFSVASSLQKVNLVDDVICIQMLVLLQKSL